MATPLRMPQPGQMTEECTVLRWYKAVGDPIAKGDALYEIETDKSNMDVESFDAGTLLAIIADEGATVPVDSVVAWVGAPGEVVPNEAMPGETVRDATPATEAMPQADVPPGATPTLPASPVGEYDAGGGGRDQSATGLAEGAGVVAAATDGGARRAISPRAGRIALELSVDPGAVMGSGPGGRIVERDIRAAAARTGAAATTGTTTEASTAGGPTDAHAASGRATDGPAAGQTTPKGAPASTPGPRDGIAEPLGRLRRVIARRLVETTSVPTFTVGAAADMTDVVALRAEWKAAGHPVTITDIVHHATIRALVEHSLVNAVTDGATLWRREHVHLGIAVAIPDGLLVPVVRNADTMTITELAEATRTVVDGARDGRLGPDELSGSSFTVSNMGMFEVDRFSAIINPGESGILAISSIRPTVVALDHGIATRQRMEMTLTADHRLVDGELAARFLGSVRRHLEDAETLHGLIGG